MSRSSRDATLFFNFLISMVGLLIILIFAYSPPIHESTFLRKPLIGLAFSIICMSGVLAALLPKHCSHVVNLQKSNTIFAHHLIPVTSHHPDCKEFSAHVIRLNNRAFCAACTGLLLGAIMALTGTFFYFFGEWYIEGTSSPTLLIGIVGLILGFLQLKFRGYSRLILNVVFVLGAFLILVGIDGLAESLFVDLFVESLIVFWILTRIQLSRWDHQRTCNRCTSPCDAHARR